MDLITAMHQRHAVRSYTDKPIADEIKAELMAEAEQCNRESGLNIALVTDEPVLFSSKIVRYGRFSGVTDYILIKGKKTAGFSEKCGYYGQRLALKAQQLGLNSCWVAMAAYMKLPSAVKIEKDEKLMIVISIGYGITQGTQHKSKTPQQVSNVSAASPQWFSDGVSAALLAPTALNQQKFRFELVGDKVKATSGAGFYTKLDLGIAKYQFEIGAGKDNSIWA